MKEFRLQGVHFQAPLPAGDPPRVFHQGHPHAAGELGSGARKPERAGVGADEGHGHGSKTLLTSSSA